MDTELLATFRWEALKMALELTMQTTRQPGDVIAVAEQFLKFMLNTKD